MHMNFYLSNDLTLKKKGDRSADIVSNDPSIAVILINYNGIEDTLQCVESLKRSIDICFKCYIVDNASPNNDGEVLAAYYEKDSQVEVLCLNDNVGFGNANNYGMEKAFSEGYKFSCLLNNDTEVDAGMLRLLFDDATEKVITVPLMLYYDNPDLIWFGGGDFDSFGIPRHSFEKQCAQAAPLKKHEITFATGCCMMISKEAFTRTGGFDGSFFLYWEDADWSVRLRAEGFKLLFVPEAKLWHKVSSSTGGEESPMAYYYGVRNRLYAIKKLNLGWKPWCWSVLGLVRAIMSHEKKYSYARNAWQDYKCSRMGKSNLFD